MKRIVVTENNPIYWSNPHRVPMVVWKSSFENEIIIREDYLNCDNVVINDFFQCTYEELDAFADDLKRIANIRSIQVATKLLETKELT